jgi:nucleoside 2-deoxyribosyltransferase
MKIYFAGPIHGGRDDKEIYFEIINHVKKFGQVLNEHVGDKKLTDAGENLPSEQIYERDMRWIKEADVFIAEASTPSVGVGYEIAVAESLGKKILCLFKQKEGGKKLSCMIGENKNLVVKKYTNLEEVLQHVEDFFN